jgi:hypothetical protein
MSRPTTPTSESSTGSVRTAADWVEEFAAGWRAPTGPDTFADHFERLFAADARLTQPDLPTLVGPNGLREGFARPLFTLLPDARGTVLSWGANGAELFIEIEVQATLGGRPVSITSVDHITLRDGLAIERRAHANPLPVISAALRHPSAWPRLARARRLQRRHLHQAATHRARAPHPPPVTNPGGER